MRALLFLAACFIWGFAVGSAISGSKLPAVINIIAATGAIVMISQMSAKEDV